MFRILTFYYVRVMDNVLSLTLCEIITVKLKAGLLLNASLRIRLLTFINKAIRLSSSPFVASTAAPYFSLAGVHDVLC